MTDHMSQCDACSKVAPDDELMYVCYQGIDTYACCACRSVEDELDEAQSDEPYLGAERWHGPDATPDDTPSLSNCDDWGTGEGRWHGRC